MVVIYIDNDASGEKIVTMDKTVQQCFPDGILRVIQSIFSQEACFCFVVIVEVLIDIAQLFQQRPGEFSSVPKCCSITALDTAILQQWVYWS